MKILVITQYFPPDITAAAFRIADTLEHVVAQGHEVRVLTAIPHKAQANESDSASNILQLVKVYRCHVSDIGKGGFRRYLVHYLSFVWGSLWKGINLFLGGWRPDVVWATSPPLFVGLSGRLMSILFGRALVLDIRDIWPDSAVSAGQLSKSGKAYRIGKVLERYLYGKARQITCVASPMRDYIAQHTKRPISIIYNGVSDRILHKPLCNAENVTQKTEQKTILYAGNLGRVQALDMVIQAFADLAKENLLGQWRLRMIGAGALSDELKAMVQELSIGHCVSIEPPMTRDAVTREMELTDALFLSLRPDPVLRITIPSKVFDYLLVGRPIIGGIVGEGKEILESTGANLCYDPESLQSLKATLKMLFNDYGILDQQAYKNQDLVLSKFTRKEGASTLISVLTVCTAGN